MSAFRPPRRLVLGLFVFVWMIAALPASAQTADNDVIAVLLRDGAEALAAGRYAEAHARLAEVLRLDWNHPRAYDLLQQVRQERAHALLQWEAEARNAEYRRDPGQAVWIYQRILAEDSTRADLLERVRRLTRQRESSSYVRTGMEKFMADDFAGAQLDFEQALAINPNDTLAAQYRERTRQKIAATGSLAAIQADSAAWGKYLDAMRRLREGNLAAAERLWSDLLVLFPGNENLRSNLDQVRRRRGGESASVDDE